MGGPALPLESRYERITESGCWIFNGGLDSDGYGTFGDNVKAHRAFYQRLIGPIPQGACVLHRCDVRCCVNPAHLFLGTSRDNTADKVAKGRQTRGMGTKRSKLTDTGVVLIIASNEPCFVLANRLGITDTSVSNVRLGKTWKHIPRPAGYTYTPYRAPGTHETWEELGGVAL